MVHVFSLYRDTYDEAKYFTYDTEKSKCRCKPDMNLDVTATPKTNRNSGNVDCVFEVTSSNDLPPPEIGEASIGGSSIGSSASGGMILI